MATSATKPKWSSAIFGTYPSSSSSSSSSSSTSSFLSTSKPPLRSSYLSPTSSYLSNTSSYKKYSSSSFYGDSNNNSTFGSCPAPQSKCKVTRRTCVFLFFLSIVHYSSVLFSSLSYLGHCICTSLPDLSSHEV